MHEKTSVKSTPSAGTLATVISFHFITYTCFVVKSRRRSLANSVHKSVKCANDIYFKSLLHWLEQMFDCVWQVCQPLRLPASIITSESLFCVCVYILSRHICCFQTVLFESVWKLACPHLHNKTKQDMDYHNICVWTCASETQIRLMNFEEHKIHVNTSWAGQQRVSHCKRQFLPCSALAGQSKSNIREEYEQNPTCTPDSTGQGAQYFHRGTLCISQPALTDPL